MRLADLIRENATSKDAVLDLLTAMAGEGLDSIPLETLSDELSHQGIDLDENALFDYLYADAVCSRTLIYQDYPMFYKSCLVTCD